MFKRQIALCLALMLVLSMVGWCDAGIFRKRQRDTSTELEADAFLSNECTERSGTPYQSETPSKSDANHDTGSGLDLFSVVLIMGVVIAISIRVLMGRKPEHQIPSPTANSHAMETVRDERTKSKAIWCCCSDCSRRFKDLKNEAMPATEFKTQAVKSELKEEEGRIRKEAEAAEAERARKKGEQRTQIVAAAVEDVMQGEHAAAVMGWTARCEERRKDAARVQADKDKRQQKEEKWSAAEAARVKAQEEERRQKAEEEKAARVEEERRQEEERAREEAEADARAEEEERVRAAEAARVQAEEEERKRKEEEETKRQQEAEALTAAAEEERRRKAEEAEERRRTAEEEERRRAEEERQQEEEKSRAVEAVRVKAEEDERSRKEEEERARVEEEKRQQEAEALRAEKEAREEEEERRRKEEAEAEEEEELPAPKRLSAAAEAEQVIRGAREEEQHQHAAEEARHVQSLRQKGFIGFDLSALAPAAPASDAPASPPQPASAEDGEEEEEEAEAEEEERNIAAKEEEEEKKEAETKAACPRPPVLSVPASEGGEQEVVVERRVLRVYRADKVTRACPPPHPSAAVAEEKGKKEDEDEDEDEKSEEESEEENEEESEEAAEEQRMMRAVSTSPPRPAFVPPLDVSRALLPLALSPPLPETKTSPLAASTDAEVAAVVVAAAEEEEEEEEPVWRGVRKVTPVTRAPPPRPLSPEPDDLSLPSTAPATPPSLPLDSAVDWWQSRQRRSSSASPPPRPGTPPSSKSPRAPRLTPVAAATSSQSPGGVLAGVGLRLLGKDGGPQRVESCNVGQAAALSQRIATHDLLTHVDGVSVLARPVAPLVLGPEGSTVTLRFSRPATPPRTRDLHAARRPAAEALNFEVPLVRGSAEYLAQRSRAQQ